jgi:intracellular septation protein A
METVLYIIFGVVLMVSARLLARLAIKSDVKSLRKA